MAKKAAGCWLLLLLLSTNAEALERMWGNQEGGEWTTNANWASGVRPNGTRDYATLGSSSAWTGSYNITVASPVNLTGAPNTAAEMVIGYGGWSITGSPITLNTTINESGGANTSGRTYLRTTVDTASLWIYNQLLCKHNGATNYIRIDGSCDARLEHLTTEPMAAGTLEIRAEPGSTSNLEICKFDGGDGTRLVVTAANWRSTGSVYIWDISAFIGTLNFSPGILILGSTMHTDASFGGNSSAINGTLLIDAGVTFNKNITYYVTGVGYYTKTFGVNGAGRAVQNANITCGHSTLSTGSGQTTFVLAAPNPDGVLALNGGMASSATGEIINIVGPGTVLFTTANVTCSIPTLVRSGFFGGDLNNISTIRYGSPTTFMDGAGLTPGADTNQVGQMTFGDNLDLSGTTAPGAFLFDLATPAASDKVVVACGLNVGHLSSAQFKFNPLDNFGAGTFVLFNSPNAPIACKSLDTTPFPIGDSWTGSLRLTADKKSIELVVVGN